MNNKIFLTLAVFAVTLLTSCEAIIDIFQAGMYVGVIAVVIVIAIIIWIISKFRGR